MRCAGGETGATAVVLFGNTFPGAPVPDAWPAQNPAAYTVISSLVIIAIFAPLAVNKYRKVASR